MKKLFTFFCLTVLFVITSQAQTVIINTGTAGTPAYNAGPVYRSAAGSAYDASRYTYLYTGAELSAAGITSGSVISLVGWVKNNTATSLGAGGIFRIYMKNTSAASFSLASETWANLNTVAVLVYENLTTDNPIDLCRYQVLNCYSGKIGLINSGGESKGDSDLSEAVTTAVINKRAGGMGLIMGRKAFQKPFKDGIELLNTTQSVYLDDSITIA